MKKNGFTLVEIMVVVAIIGLLAAFAVPNFAKARQRTQRQVCIANLKQIEEAKFLWSIDGGTGTPVMGDLVPDYVKEAPTCPSGGTYTVGDMDTDPSCSKAASPDLHVLP